MEWQGLDLSLHLEQHKTGQKLWNTGFQILSSRQWRTVPTPFSWEMGHIGCEPSDWPCFLPGKSFQAVYGEGGPQQNPEVSQSWGDTDQGSENPWSCVWRKDNYTEGFICHQWGPFQFSSKHWARDPCTETTGKKLPKKNMQKNPQSLHRAKNNLCFLRRKNS